MTLTHPGGLFDGGDLPPVTDVFGAAISVARHSVGSVASVPVWGCDDPTVLARLHEALALRAQADELVCRLVAEVDSRGLAKDAGAASTSAFVSAAHRISRAEAAGLVARGKTMTDRLEVTRQAWANGEISGEQAQVIGRAVNRVGTGVDVVEVDAGQLDLIGHAQTLSLEQLKVVANRLVEVVDPDGTDQALAVQLEAEERRARQQAVFRGRTGLDGVARFSGRIPNLQFSMLKRALDAIASPRRPGEAGSDANSAAPVVGEGERALVPYGQRLGIALCELIEHLPTDTLPRHGVTNATVVVTIDEQDLRDRVGAATLDTGEPVSAGQVRRLACNAGLLPLVLGTDSAILDLGLTRRLFDRHQRLALTVRDRGCIWPGCDRPPAWCEAHHIQTWSTGGPTDLSNGVLLCSFHHHLIHAGEGWQVRLAADGKAEIIPPTRLDPTRTPQRHERHRQPNPAERTARAGPVHRNC